MTIKLETLKSKFSTALVSAIEIRTELLASIEKLIPFGEFEINMPDESSFILDTHQHTLNQICEDLTQKHQGLSKNTLCSSDYFFNYFVKNNEAIKFNDIDFPSLVELLTNDAKSLEDEGLKTTAKLLANHLLGYELDQVKRSKSFYQCSNGNGQYAESLKNTVDEIKLQLSVALGFTGEDADLTCFSDYMEKLDSVDYSHELPREVFGNKTNRIFISHFKDKFTIQISPLLFESVIAFISIHESSIVENYILPVAA